MTLARFYGYICDGETKNCISCKVLLWLSLNCIWLSLHVKIPHPYFPSVPPSSPTCPSICFHTHTQLDPPPPPKHTHTDPLSVSLTGSHNLPHSSLLHSSFTPYTLTALIHYQAVLGDIPLQCSQCHCEQEIQRHATCIKEIMHNMNSMMLLCVQGRIFFFLVS